MAVKSKPSNCKTCNWSKIGPGGKRRCHARSPQIAPITNKVSQVDHVTAWPVVNDDDWCGEWDRKSNARSNNRR